jgi:hypothetical protein
MFGHPGFHSWALAHSRAIVLFVSAGGEEGGMGGLKREAEFTEEEAVDGDRVLAADEVGWERREVPANPDSITGLSQLRDG